MQAEMAVRLLTLPFSCSCQAHRSIFHHLPKPHFQPCSTRRASCRAMASSAIDTTKKKASPLVFRGVWVLVPIAFGTEEIEAVVIVDLLRRAGADVLVASIEEGLEVEASRRVKVAADEMIPSCLAKDFDLIALPGGMSGSSRLRDCDLLKKITTTHAEQGRLVGAICAAPAVVLQEWGLLKGRKATCHPSVIDRMGASLAVGPKVQRDGNITTSRGPGTAFEFALDLVEQLFGKEKYGEVLKPLVLQNKAETLCKRDEFNLQDWGTRVPQVIVPVANGSEEMEAVIIIDVLRRAGFKVVVASVENNLQIVASRGVKIVADTLIQDVKGTSFDLIVLPGGMPGAERLRDSEALMKLLNEQADLKKPIGAICASPAVVLEAGGLLKGKKATCHPGFVSHLSDSSAAETRVVIDGLYITSRGPGTAMEFSLSIVEKFLGSEKAMNIAEAMVFDYPCL